MTHPNAYSQSSAQQYSYYYNHPEAMQPQARVAHRPQASMASRPHPSSRPARLLPQKKRRRPPFLWAGAGGGVVAFAALVVNPQFVSQEVAVTTVCEQRVEDQSVLSRDELTELLAIPERSSQEAVQAVIDQPFCVLNPTEVRAGVPAEREAYPLAFDPQTWLIVLYEEGEYAGYDFSFTRE